MVLMKNNGALPLKAGQKIAVVGPNAFSCQFGDYSLPRFDIPTPAEAIGARAGQSGGSVTTARGCEVYGSDRSGFDEALALAAESDAVVCIIGGKSMKGYGVGWGSEEESILTCGEGCDMHDLIPGGPQLELCRALIATGKPVTVVMIDGRPETLFDVAENCGALVAAWYPGEEGSAALAELLFGDVNFSGKLPVTFPRHVGQVPICHDRVPSGGGFYHAPGTPDRPGRDYVFSRPDAAFDFGFGLGYSEIAYTGLAAAVADGGEAVNVTVTVENKGDYAAEEAVLAFLRDEIATIPQPQKKLAAMTRVTLAPGESTTVQLAIPMEAFAYTDLSMRKVLEKGWFTILVGGRETRILLG
jgi:beta-glucosidase